MVHKWSKNVTEHDHPYDLPPGIFKSADPDVIAAALQHSAEDSQRHSQDPYRTAMSMLDFYIDRAGKIWMTTSWPRWSRQKSRCVGVSVNRPTVNLLGAA